MLNIIRRLALQHRSFLLACGLLLFVFQVVVAAIIASLDLSRTLEGFLMFAPPAIRAIIEQTMPGGSTAGVLAFTWNHPVTHALITAIAITFGARAIAGEIENGAIELILAQPLSRVNYLAAHVLFALMSMAFVVLVGLLGAVVGERAFGLEPFAWDRLLRLSGNLLLLQMSFYSLTLACSAFGREGGRVAVLAVLIAIVSYLDNVIATLWNKAAFMRPYSFHTYYDPREILVNGNLGTWPLAVLGVFTLAAIGVAFARFLTRDLP